MEEMDMMAYWEFLDLPRAYVDNSMEYTTFLLPCDITYYEMRDGRYIPVYTLTAGMRVVAIDGNERYLTGYGDVSYPTYTRGWRYVRPYLTTDDPEAPPVWGADDPRLAGVPFYYARVEELTEILLYLSQQSAGGQEPIEYGDWLGDYLKNYGFFTQKRALLLQTDAVLRWFGIYLSPDYRLPYFDTTNIVLLSAAGVLLTLHIVLRVRRARQQRQVEGGRK